MYSKLPKTKSNTFLKYVHLYRAFAILLIVAGHVFASLEWPSIKLYKVIDIILFDNISLIFVFITGFLFQFLIKKYKFKSYFTKKLKFVILPYIIISIPVILLRILIDKPTSNLLSNHPDFAAYNPMYQFFYYLVTGTHLRPFWFIPMVFLFYLTSPLFKLLNNYPKFYLPVICLLLLVSFYIPRPGTEYTLLLYLHFLSIYVIGMFVSYHRNKIIEIVVKNWVISTFFLLMLMALSIEYPFSQISFAQKLFASVYFLAILWKLEGVFEVKMEKVANYSFGIFFLHDYFDLLYKVILQKMTGETAFKGHMVTYLILLVVIISLSIITIKIIKKIAGKHSKIIIGV